MRRRLIPLLAVIAIAASACGDAATPPTTTLPAEEIARTAAFPVIVRGTALEERPERIVSLSATHTEILYAIGAGPMVTAMDLFSDYPPETASVEKIDAFNLNVEAVAALDPDLVLLAFDPGDAVSGLAALGIPTVLFAPPGPTDLDGVYSEIGDIGALTGLTVEADALVESMRADVEEIVAGLPGTGPSTYYFLLLRTRPDAVFGGRGNPDRFDHGDARPRERG